MGPAKQSESDFDRLSQQWLIAQAMRFRSPFFRQAAPGSSVPDGWRIYAIGDVHGCLDQLNRLLGAIEADLNRRAAKGHLIFLGDLVDRGPDSAGVVNRLLSGPLPGDQKTFLLGNHEEILLDCFDGNIDTCGPWLQFGGIQTLESYGLSRAEIFDRTGALSDAMREVIPADHISFIRSFTDYLQVGDYLFVHAGIRPDVALDQQSTQDLRWIRSEFLDSPVDHGLLVVHGHSIVPEIEVRHNRISVDTGCYRTGHLSALVLEGTSKGKLVVQ
jgi:serine/threonine protein phosphatase 1